MKTLMITGYVALLDVLGFSSLVSGGADGERLGRYLECLQESLADDANDRIVDYVVFSDSITLTTRDDSEESLQALLRQCSRTFGLMLKEEIPLRGAIAHGTFYRSPTNAEGTFVAGKAIIDAYRFETEQDWVGIMLAPSALKKIPDLKKRCMIGDAHTDELYQGILDRLPWAAFVQWCPAIPFHSTSPFESNSFQGFSIVPSYGMAEPAALRDSLDASLKKLEWLKSLAPNPAAQKKYQRSHQWLSQVYVEWRQVAYWIERREEERLAAEQIVAGEPQ